MRLPATKVRTSRPSRLLATLAVIAAGATPVAADLLDNLGAFPTRLKVGDPDVTAADGAEGPKAIATADFNGDQRPDFATGNLDGTITVRLNLGGGAFAASRHVRTGARELRSVLAADLNGDGRPDLAAASPQDAQIAVFFNTGGGNFGPKVSLPGWIGVRCLVAGDFDGDHITDIAAAGPGLGVRHLRGKGGRNFEIGNFEIMGDLVRLSPRVLDLTHPRPVYKMQAIRSRDGLRDDLLVTHADSPELWILSTAIPDRWNEQPLLVRTPAWKPGDPPVIINEVQVQNTETLKDEDGTFQPWVELLNRSPNPVNLSGLQLDVPSSPSWDLPPLTIEPGRFLIVFLSGKDRDRGELHTDFVLKQNTDAIQLENSGGGPVSRIDLPPHTATDISRGMAPDEDKVKWFDIPSPGAENNAGMGDISELFSDLESTLTITPREPGPGQSVAIKVTMPEHPTGATVVRAVWFSATPGVTENHYLLKRTSSGVFETVLAPGLFRGDTRHRVLARLMDGNSNKYTIEAHRGLDDPQTTTRVRPRPGCLRAIASVPSPKAKSFEAGPIFAPPAQPGAAIDLVSADEENGFLEIRPASTDARRFMPVPWLQLQIAGAPRDVKLADMDSNGWNDAVVVKRNEDVAVICRNLGGVLQLPNASFDTGFSPREAVIADFTGDGKPDAAIINRYSQDVSILASSAGGGGPALLDTIYAVDGEVSALKVADLNGDGLDDVLQLHRGSGELSVRYSGKGGRLKRPEFFLVGASGASAMALEDVNNDGRKDVITANLGTLHDGSISVLLAAAGGGFEPARVFNAGASLFAISVDDFNNDGKKDVVAGLWDCRVIFFNGDGSGSFNAASPPVPFVNECRIMVTRDFDQDGDTDVAGVGVEGDLVVLENLGAAGNWQWLKHYDYNEPPANRVYGANRIGLTNLDNDGDDDLIVGTGHGVLLFRGLPGVEFSRVDDPVLSGIPYAVSDVLTGDINGDGVLDMVAACRGAACLDVLEQLPDGSFRKTKQVDVPSCRHLASGDLDHDGKPDLVGTGDVLWTVLSSRLSQPAPPESTQTIRPRTGGVVINEILGRNKGISVAADKGRNSDYVEIYNGGIAAVDLAGWTIDVLSEQEGTPVDQTWTLPAMIVPAGGRTVLVFAESEIPAVPGSMRTGFMLPAEGGTVTLRMPDNSAADQVIYPHAQENVSWSRFLDGHPSFHADPVPSPGLANLDNGRVPPEVKLNPPSPGAMQAGKPITFTARGFGYAGIISLSLIWKRIDEPFSEPQRINLYDDGRHGDGPPVDGIYAATLAPGLPAGAEVQFYLEAIDLSGEVLQQPETAALSPPGQPPVAWSFAIAEAPTLEISEVCSDNVTLLRDERGGYPDFIKVRNTGAAPVDLSRILLAKSPLSESAEIYQFPSGQVLQPGAEFTILADSDPSEGPLHAPFSLDADGGDLALFALTPSGARNWIHSVSVAAMQPDYLYSRLPDSTLWQVVPGRNVSDDSNYWAGSVNDENGNAWVAVRFRAWAACDAWRVEGDASGAPVAWTTLEIVPGDDEMHTVARPQSQFGALRVVPTLMPPARIMAAMPGVTDARIFCSAPGARAAWICVGPEDCTPDDTKVVNVGADFEFSLKGLTPDTVYHRRVWVFYGNGDTWSDTFSFRTLPAETVTASSLILNSLTATDVAVTPVLNASLPAGGAVTLLIGTEDAFDNIATWPRRVPAVTGNNTIFGLVPETTYFIRAAVSTPAATAVSATRLTFRTPATSTILYGDLVISEIMYNPLPPTPAELAAGFIEAEDFEFVELQNLSVEPRDLSGLWLNGIKIDFPQSGAPILPPGGLAVIAANPHAFAMRYGNAISLAGWTLHPFRISKLSNNGEGVGLNTAGGDKIFDEDYGPVGTPGYALFWDGDRYGAGPAPGGTPGMQSFSEWNALHTGGTGASDDPDRDGLSNLSEFVFNTDPYRPNQGNFLTIRDGGFVAGKRTILLSFPVNPAAYRSELTLQTMIPGSWVSLASVVSPPPSATPPYNFSPLTFTGPFPGTITGLEATVAVPIEAIGAKPARLFRLTFK